MFSVEWVLKVWEDNPCNLKGKNTAGWEESEREGDGLNGVCRDEVHG